MEIKDVGIITHPEVNEGFVQEIVGKLRNKRLFFDPVTARKTKKKKTRVRDMVVDLALILGGDGTLLWSINELKPGPMILGVNTGRVGYLTELKTENAVKGIDQLLAGDFSIEERMRMKANNRYEALNEFVILPERPAALLEFGVKLDQKEEIRFRADGILVSTQTGSTGHALSLGGPAIHPTAGVYLVAPMIPFMREQPPLIIPDTSKTEIRLLRENRKACLVSDGNLVKTLTPGAAVSFEKSKNSVRFVRFSVNGRKWKTKKTGFWS